jgi:hypothetical protein
MICSYNEMRGFSYEVLATEFFPLTCAGILYQSSGARNRVGNRVITGLQGYLGWRNRVFGID